MASWIRGCVLIVLFSFCGLARTQADDWPQWLGPQRDSVWRESGILTRFPPEGPKLVWKSEVGAGYAGPAVALGRVFVADFLTDEIPYPSASRRDELVGTERLLCLSADSGQPLWQHAHPCTYNISYPYGPRVTPTVDGDRVYMLGAEGHLCCLNVEDGSVIWSKELTQEYNFETPVWGCAGHPLVDGDKLICLVGGEGSVAVALDKMTGHERWRALTAPAPGYCPPTIIEAGGTRQLLIWHTRSVNSLNPETGEVYWTEPLEPSYEMSIVAPRQCGSYLFVGGVVLKSMMLKLGHESPSAEVIWTGQKDRGISPAFCPPLLAGDTMYGVDMAGELRCVELATGKQLWSTYDATTGSRRRNYASAFLVKQADQFFLFNDQGELIVAHLSPQGYQELGRAKLLEATSKSEGHEVVWSHPAFAQKCIFARNNHQIVCYSLAAP